MGKRRLATLVDLGRMVVRRGNWPLAPFLVFLGLAMLLLLILELPVLFPFFYAMF